MFSGFGSVAGVGFDDFRFMIWMFSGFGLGLGLLLGLG